MKANEEIIHDTVEKLVMMQSASSIADYINKAITMHREYVSFKATITMQSNRENLCISFFYAEVQNDNILLIGFKYINDSLDTSKKVRITLKKDSR